MTNKVVISMIGNHDPIGLDRDGPMLHVVRSYKPKAIYLLLTDTMQSEAKVIALQQSINHLYSYYNLEKPVIHNVALSIKNPARFENFNFTSIMKAIMENHLDSEFYVNISSGTPQMIASMCLEIVTNQLNVQAVQIDSPEPKQKNDFVFNFDLDKNVDFTDKATRRVYQTNLFEFNRSKVKQKLTTLIEAYDYKNAYQFCLENPIISKDVTSLIFEALNLEEMTSKKQYFTRCKFETYESYILGYYVQWELEYHRKKYINYILKSTPLLFALMRTELIKKLDKVKFEILIQTLEKSNLLIKEQAVLINPSTAGFFKGNKDRDFAYTSVLLQLYSTISTDKYIYDILKKLRHIESNTRNEIAHKINIASISKEKYKKDAENLHQMMQITLKYVLKDVYNDQELEIFSQKNQEILEEIKKL